MPCFSSPKPFDKLRDLPILKFVEPVETNSDVTSTLASHTRLFHKLKAS